MFSSLFGPGVDYAAINRLFDAPSTPIDAVLEREDILPYLRQFVDPTKIPQSILRFVAGHVQQLLIAAQQKYLVANAGDGNVHDKIITPSALKSTLTSLSGAARGGSPPSMTGNAADTRGTTDHSAAAAAPLPADRNSAANSDDIQGSVLPERSLACVHSRSVNSTELLFFYISSREAGSEAIGQIVPVTIAALAHPSALDPYIALSIQRLLLAAFDNDFFKTTETIAATLDEELVLGVIQNVSQNSVVAETMIALFGSALSASTMMDPTTQTELFTSAWISCRFVELFCAQLPLVIKERRYYNYFYFFRELLRRGFSHTAGPIVDGILSAHVFAPMLEMVIATCEADAHGPVPTREDANSSLAPDAMAVMAAVVSTMRKSLILPETRDMYATTTDYIAPLLAVRQQKERLVGLLQHRNTSGAAIVSDDTLGLTRSSVCEIFTELALYQVSSTDAIVVESGFVPAFLRLCERYPASNGLARLLEAFVKGAFTRPLLERESARDALSRDILLRALVEAEESLPAMGGSDGGGGGGGGAAAVSQAASWGHMAVAAGAPLSSLLYFATADALRYTPLAAFSTSLLHTLSTVPLLRADPPGPLAHLLAAARANAAVRARTEAMMLPITGEQFSAKGSARTPVVVHRPVVNLVGDRLSSKLGMSSALEKTVGSPTTWRASAGPAAPSAFARLCRTVLNDGPAPDPPDGGSGGRAVVGLATPELAALDLDAIAAEVHLLRAAGSPQLQAYPDFRSMHMGFGGAPVDVEGFHSDGNVPRDEKQSAPTGGGEASDGAPRDAAAVVDPPFSAPPAIGDGVLSSDGTAATVEKEVEAGDVI